MIIFQPYKRLILTFCISLNQTKSYNTKMNKFPLIASGVASTSLNGEILAIRYTKIVCKSENADEYKSLESEKQIPSIIKDRERFIFHKLNQDTAIKNVKDAYLKLHLLSLKLVKPNTINLEGIFNALPNVVWTSQGPVHPDDLEEIRKDNDSLYVRSIDKFPCLTDYVIPEGIRIADASRVRLGPTCLKEQLLCMKVC